MSKLLEMHASSHCPADCKKHLETVATAAPQAVHGKIADVIHGVTTAGVPWITIVMWIATNLPKLLSLFSSGLSIQAIIELILSFLKPTPAPA